MPDITAGFPVEPAVFLPSCFRRRDLDRPAPCRYSPLRGPIAQLVEPPAHNRQVPGSRPGGPTTQASCGQQERAGRFFCAQHTSIFPIRTAAGENASHAAPMPAPMPVCRQGTGCASLRISVFRLKDFCFSAWPDMPAPPGTVFCQPWNRPGMGKPREQGVICAGKRPSSRREPLPLAARSTTGR